MRPHLAALIVLLLAAQLPAQTFTQQIVRRLRRPLFATSPVGDQDRLFIVEQGSGDTARIRILDLQTNEMLSDPFLTLTGLTTSGERGLLGLAFHPDYADNGRLYVYASKPGGSQNHRSHLFEYQVRGDPLSAISADSDSVRTVLTFDQPFGNHNGGWIGFDPTATGADQSYLYVATGDGGSGGDPRNSAQDITDNWLGKILRIDVDGDDFPANDRNYAIPPSNPFVGSEADDEIFVYGLRNPWRVSFDRRTGDLWIGDVGQDELEEISFLPADSGGGQNFGWRVMEGNACFDPNEVSGNPPCNDPSFVPAVYDYGHGNGDFQGFSVTGGYLYNGPVKEFQGHYFFADFVSGNIWTLDPYAARATPPIRQNDALVADVGRPAQIASFAEDANAELYIVSISGTIHKVSSTSRDSTWVGSDAASGAAGDGSSWDDANNWVRDGVADAGFVPGDHLVIAGVEPLQLPEEQITISALTFEADGNLRGDAQITSGNLSVAEGATAQIDGKLSAASSFNTIRKLGEGHLALRPKKSSRVPRYALLEGTTTLVNTPAEPPELQPAAPVDILLSGGRMEQADQELPALVRDLSISDDGMLRLWPTTESTFFDALANPIVQAESGQLGGSLEVVLPGNFEFPASAGGQVWLPLINFSEFVGGEFAAVQVLDATVGHQGDGSFLILDYDTLTGGNDVSLVAYRAVPGDANGDRQVSFEDFLIVSDNFASPGGWTEGDFDDSGVVQFADFLAVSANFGLNLLPAVAAPVPEPASCLLLVIGMFTLLVQRRR